MKIAWGITGAGHFLRESFEVFKELKRNRPELKVTSKAGTIHPHPTLPEALAEAAEAALGKVIHI